MSNDDRGSFEITKDAFASIEALVKDALGNATMTGDCKRFHIGASYLRLAAQQSAALADLVDSVADQHRRRGDKAKKRLSEIDRDIERHLDAVAADNERYAKENGAVQMRMKREDLAALIRGEQPPADLVAKIEAMQKERKSA